MKLLSCSFCVLLLLSITLSCTNDEPELKKAVLSKQEILSSIQAQLMHVTKIERKSGNTITDLTDSSDLTLYRKELFLTFREGYILFLTGREIPNTKFQATAKTYSFSVKIPLPLNLGYKWDDAMGTVVAQTYQKSDYLPVPVDVPATLDVASIIYYKTLAEAQAATIPPSLKFTADMVDPKLGAVTYSFILRPVWAYEVVSDIPNTYNFVMF